MTHQNPPKDGKLPPPSCENCDGRKCMACVCREYHDACADDCPVCCPPTTRGDILAERGLDKNIARTALGPIEWEMSDLTEKLHEGAVSSGTGYMYGVDEPATNHLMEQAADRIERLEARVGVELELRRAAYDRIAELEEGRSYQYTKKLHARISELEPWAEWAYDADHYPGCSWGLGDQYCCKCGLRELQANQ